MTKITKEEMENLGEQIKVLFTFCCSLIPQKEVLKEFVASTKERTVMAANASVLIEACGGDAEDKVFQSTMQAKRGEALLNLIEVLDATHTESLEFDKQKAEKEKTKKLINQIF